MLVGGSPQRTIALGQDGWSVDIIYQRALPHRFVRVQLQSVEEMAHAIRDMWLRGAPLIGAAAAYGLALATRRDPSNDGLARAMALLVATRPTAVNLRWAVNRVHAQLRGLPTSERPAAAYAEAAAICDEDVAVSRAIAENGLPLLERVARGDRPVQILTHCNAGWLATVDWGTALAPVYLAHERGIPVHVWVDETRPRNQGALTAWELTQQGIPHTYIADNAGGLLLARGQVDLCIVGSDRTTARGDVCNKIGTYLKALAARAAAVPFYVALPSSTLDFSLQDGSEIHIEERDPSEVTEVSGLGSNGLPASVQILPSGTKVWNPGFDVTPAALVTALITERGVCPATPAALASLYPERVE